MFKTIVNPIKNRQKRDKIDIRNYKDQIKG